MTVFVLLFKTGKSVESITVYRSKKTALDAFNHLVDTWEPDKDNVHDTSDNETLRVHASLSRCPNVDIELEEVEVQ